MIIARAEIHRLQDTPQRPLRLGLQVRFLQPTSSRTFLVTLIISGGHRIYALSHRRQTSGSRASVRNCRNGRASKLRMIGIKRLISSPAEGLQQHIKFIRQSLLQQETFRDCSLEKRINIFAALFLFYGVRQMYLPTLYRTTISEMMITEWGMFCTVVYLDLKSYYLLHFTGPQPSTM